uniref:Matrix metallopeptidase 17 n=1 Tax=Vombatus ursinus TaxID=29139 RepID=A0A4X2JXC6_VOMUR
MDPGYPAESPLWRGIPSILDDAMRWSDGASYFFRGKDYWKVLDSELEAAPGYPQSTAKDWLVCSDMQADGPENEVRAEGARTGARSRPGQHDESRSDGGYEVCSCTSNASSGTSPLLVAQLAVASLWTAAPMATVL